MIKICFPFVGDSFGGSHKSSILLIEHLDKAKFEPVIVLHKKGKLSEYLDNKKIEYKYLHMKYLAGSEPKILKIILNIIFNFFKIFHFIKTNKINIVHSNDLRCNLTWSLPSKISCKHIWHQRTQISNSKIWKIVPYITNRIIFISNSIEKWENHKSKIVYNPFQIQSFEKNNEKQNIIKNYNINKNYKLIISVVGRIEIDKGIETIIKIAKMIPDAMFLIIGNNLYKGSFPENTKIINFIDDVERVIAGCDLLLSASLKEGFGRSVVEAMLVETPVVAANIPSYNEISTSKKYLNLVENNSPKYFVNKINQVIEEIDVKRENYISARIFAENKFSLSEHISRMENIYESLS